MCQGPLWAKFDAEYKFQQSQGVHIAPTWFPVGVVVVMSLVFPTRLDPSAFCGVSVVVASRLPTRWGPNVLAAVSVSGISPVVLVGLFASIVSSYVCRRHGSIVSCLPSVSAGATGRVPVVGEGPAASRCQRTASGIVRRSAAAVLHPHTISLCTLLVHTIACVFGTGVCVCVLQSLCCHLVFDQFRD